MDEIWKTLAASGTTGAIVVWILWKLIPAIDTLKDEICAGLRKMEAAMDRATKTDLLRLIASPHVADVVKEKSNEILAEVNDALADNKAQAERDKNK